MHNNKRISDIKRAQKSSLLHKTISDLFFRAMLDDTRLTGVTLTRVRLSDDKSVCDIFFVTEEGEQAFQEKLQDLILYKPSLRAAIAKQIPGRYTPNLVFKYDTQEEGMRKIDQILLDLKKKGEL